MRSVLFTTLAGLIALFVVASPKPASALAGTTALNHSQANPSGLVEVRRYRRRYYRRHYRRPYYRRYYSRPYRYRRPNYRPYRYYGRPNYRPYYYRRRPGVSVYIGI